MTLNKQQSQLEQDEICIDAIKSEIREALKWGPGLAREIASRIGMRPHQIVGYLHEMESSGEISFSWVRGYKL